MVNPFGKLRKISEGRRIMKEIERKIDKLEADIEKEITGFVQIRELEQRKIEILTGIKDLWQEKWKKAEDFVTKTIPSLIDKQLAYLKEDIDLAKKDERLVIKLMEEGEIGKTFWMFDKNTRDSFLGFVKTKKNLEREIIGLFEPIRQFYINLEKNLETQKRHFKQEKAWILINESSEYLDKIKEENAKIQEWGEFYKKRYAAISHYIRTTKILLETNFEDLSKIKDFLERVKEKCGFHLYGSDSGYRKIYQKNIPEKTQTFIERICELPADIIGRKIRSIAYPSHVNYDVSLDCNEIIFYQTYNAPTKEVLTKGDDEKPTIFIYYCLSEGTRKGRTDRLTATLVLGAEDATKLLIYFKKNSSKIYDFFRTFHDRFNTIWIDRNSKILFVPIDLNEIIIEYEKDHYLFNVREEFFKNFILTY